MLQLAQKIARKYGTNNPADILDAMGVKVFYLPLSGVRGIYKKIKRLTIIFIDSDLDERTQRFVLGHELGHHLLHRGDNRVFLDRCTYFRTSIPEHQADLFSACLIAPNPEDYISEGTTYEQIACRLGVSNELAIAYCNEAICSSYQ